MKYLLTGIDREQWKEYRKYCKKNGMTVRQELESFIKKVIGINSSKDLSYIAPRNSITIKHLDISTKRSFKTLCKLRKTTMQEELTRMIEAEIIENLTKIRLEQRNNELSI